MVIKRRKKNGRIYREEYKSVRVEGKVKSIFIRSLGPEEPVKPQKAKPDIYIQKEQLAGFLMRNVPL